MDLLLASAEPPIRYAGDIAIDDAKYAISVVVDSDGGAADGLSCAASGPELPDEMRDEIERLAAAMARKAVRGAQKDGLKPPRRIRRWRSVQG